MNTNEYQMKIERTARKFQGNRDAELMFLASGLAEEAGEVMQAARELVFKDKEVSNMTVALELGDCLYYITQLAKQFGFSIEEIMQLNIDKLNVRYPEDLP